MFGEKVFGEKVFGEKVFGEKVFGEKVFGEKATMIYEYEPACVIFTLFNIFLCVGDKNEWRK